MHHTAAVVRPATNSSIHPLKLPFTSQLSGTITQEQASGGAILDMELRLSGGTTGALRGSRLGGQPQGGGGLSLSGSQVDLAPTGSSTALVGKVTALNGTEVAARVRGSAQPVDLLANLRIDQQTGAVSGVLHAKRA